jgi:hypothetical protein
MANIYKIKGDNPMNLTNIDDSVLVQNTEKLVRYERELLTKVLHHLLEIERRRLFSDFGFKSLFDFAVRHLGYPEDQAYRRISAMRLLKEIPEIEKKIESGEISLTHIGLAQTLFKQERKNQNKELSYNQKISVFEKIANKPVREAERITLSMSSSPETAKPDRVNQISESHIELKFIASNEIQTKIEKLKGLLAHKYPNLSLGELFEKLCDIGLIEWDPAKTAAPRKRRVNPQNKSQSQAQILKAVFSNAESRCESCNSYYALEIDHIIPIAKNGTSNPDNLRILCRNCNQRAAIQEFGQQTMDRYIN